MRINLSTVMVDDQEKALDFYTNVLGFRKKTDIAKEEFRWLTVVSPDGPEEVELVLEPAHLDTARTHQQALFAAGIPHMAFFTDDIQREWRRLTERGVRFRGEPQDLGPVTAVVFEDTCGNLINLVQPV